MNKPYTDLSLTVIIKDTSLVKNINILKDQPPLLLKLLPYAVLDIYIRKISIAQLNPTMDINNIGKG